MDKFEEAWKENRHVWESSKNLAKAMYLAGQQSQQAEVDQLNKVLDERTKEWLEAIKLGTYFQEAAKPLKDEVDFLKAQLGIKRDQVKGFESEIKKAWQAVDEKDKQIDVACKSINSFFDNQVSTPTPREYANFIAEILETLRGDNANS
ncbi:hypothetical protein [Acinetobacter sp. ULE_I092]|uniref:hypothetical protein n=1 Tax=Acinetobacter sp. ULE_I092 TaxID=3373075 RepID=UPI003AF4B783